MYPDEYYPTQTFSDTYFRNHVHPVQREKLDHILSYCRAGRLLDVGCGVGFFVREASDAGFHAEGIEWSERAVEAGKQQWNLVLAAGSFLAHDFGAEQFDVVTLWQVLEHLENPALALKKVRSLVRKGGIVVIAVPNFASVQATLFRRRWYHLDIPRHLFHFTPQALSRLLEQEGFRVVRRSFRSREHNWAGIFGSVFIMTPPNEGFIHRVFRKTVGKGCSAMLAGLEMLAGRGGIVTFVAIRN
jgi:SAM-dependent methyltransferase